MDRYVPLPPLPARVSRLNELAYDLWWSWNAQAAGARAFYSRLEEDIIPVFYHRDRAGVPVAWVGRVRDTVRTGIPRFSARRAVKATAERLYNPALRHV